MGIVLDLPLIWAFVIAFTVFAYVAMDGFDLGLGMLFPFFPKRDDRSVMMNSVAPVWDGNETWLVLGGGGLLAAFPLAYSVLMPAPTSLLWRKASRSARSCRASPWQTGNTRADGGTG